MTEEDFDSESILAEQNKQRSKRAARWAQGVAYVALAIGLATLKVHRELEWSIVGYASAGLIAPGLMSFATRKVSSLSSEGDVAGRRIALVAAFNVVAVLAALAHAVYLARRFW